MKLCFSTLGCHDMKLENILQLANKYNIHAIEVRGIDNEMSNSEIFNKIDISKFEEYHIKPYILSTSCKFHDDETRDKMIEKAYEEIQIAYKNHFYGIRVFGNLIIDETSIYKVSQSINKVCKYALNYNIHVFLEVHGDFNTIEVLKEVIKNINFNNFSFIWDIGHTHSNYHKNWKLFYDELKDYITHVHIKDILNDQLVLPGHGEIDIIGIMKYLNDHQYEGYFSLEWERKWFKDLEPLEIALIEYKKCIDKV